MVIFGVISVEPLGSATTVLMEMHNGLFAAIVISSLYVDITDRFVWQ